MNGDAPGQPRGRPKRDSANGRGVDVAMNFEHERFGPIPENGQGAIDGRKRLNAVEAHVHDRAPDGDDLSLAYQINHIHPGRRTFGAELQAIFRSFGRNRCFRIWPQSTMWVNRKLADMKIEAFFAICL
jgi:hypothetical protein